MKELAKATLNNAIDHLRLANEELNRPEEDVVCFSACKHAQFATLNYLKGYLLQQGIEPTQDMTVQDLYDRCMSINPHFAKVDLETMACRNQFTKGNDCNELSKVSACFNIADHFDTLLREEKVIG